MNSQQMQLKELLDKVVDNEDMRQDIWLAILSGDSRPIFTIIREFKLRHDFIFKYQDIMVALFVNPAYTGVVRFMNLIPSGDKYLLLTILLEYIYNKELV